MHEHPTYKLLAYNPNRRMTKYTFFKQLVVDMLLRGNAYAYIERDLQNNVTQLIYIPADFVTVNYNPTNLFDDVTYIVTGFPRLIEHTEMIHILNHSNDGILGISTIHFAMQSLSISNESEQNAKQFLSSNVSGLLSVESALSENQIKNARKAWNHNVKENGGIAVLSGGWKFQNLNLNSKDAQMLESREFNSVDVARWFGVNLSKLGISSSTSYGGIEQENIAFLTDTLHPLLQKIECELEKKLYTESEREFIDVKFDVSSILRVDLKSKAEYYRTLFNIGVLTINEIRNDIDMQPIENGDKTLLQVNMTTLDNITNNTSTQLLTNTQDYNDQI
jgi:HK97 family phage portal protein